MFGRRRRDAAKPKEPRPIRYKGIVFGEGPVPTKPPGQNSDSDMHYPTRKPPVRSDS